MNCSPTSPNQALQAFNQVIKAWQSAPRWSHQFSLLTFGVSRPESGRGDAEGSRALAGRASAAGGRTAMTDRSSRQALGAGRGADLRSWPLRVILGEGSEKVAGRTIHANRGLARWRESSPSNRDQPKRMAGCVRPAFSQSAALRTPLVVSRRRSQARFARARSRPGRWLGKSVRDRRVRGAATSATWRRGSCAGC